MTKQEIKKKLGLQFIDDFKEDRAIVIKGNKQGHVDLDGNITTPIIYQDAGNFQESRAIVTRRVMLT